MPLEDTDKRTIGRLTIFLGAAPGVGKTHAMLEVACERFQEGTHVVIGWINTHGQQETERLIAGLPQILPRSIDYRGNRLYEMDVDEILRLKPQLVLVDDLAHANIPGSRHLRRFQDIEDLLQAGIDVYTTLNIQHIESVNDIVSQVTGIVVRDTVPDYIIEQADHVQLIDVSAEQLIKRFKNGKVYAPDLDEEAARKFFRIGNINALREIALRYTANRVDKVMHEYMREHHIAGPWPTAGRVMVCVSDSPFSAQLIRSARRLAGGLRAELIAVHVETPFRGFPLNDNGQDRVAKNMRLAEELGAKTYTVVGDNLVQELLELARSHNVASIVIGKPQHNRVKELWKESIVDALIRKSAGINVYVIQGNSEYDNNTNIKTSSRTEAPWKQYLISILMIVIVTLFNLALDERLELVNLALLYQLPVTLSAFWWGRWPSYFTALCAVAAFDFLFVPPHFTLTVTDIQHFWSFIIFLIVAFVIGGRTEYLRMEAALARRREKSTRALYEFSRELAAVVDLRLIAQGLAKQVAEAVGRSIIVMLSDSSGKLSVWAEHGADKRISNPVTDSREKVVAVWAFEHGQPAGRSTDTSPEAQYLYIPLVTNNYTVGVLGIHITAQYVSAEEKRLIDAWAGLAAIAVERVKLAEKAREAALLYESDRLRTALFNSISHELRTPLSTIIGSVSTLLEAEGLYSETDRRELLENIQEGSARMERLISNLLDTARLESGMMQLKIDWCDIEDIIGAALQRLKAAILRYSLKVEIEQGIPLLKADCVLLEQVLINLIDNAMKYSPRGSEILISAEADEDNIKVSVLDKGVGIPAEDLGRIFDKFYRVQQPKQVGGTGLGLSICKGIVEAHGGKITAERRKEGGSIISFTVPLAINGKITTARKGRL